MINLCGEVGLNIHFYNNSHLFCEGCSLVIRANEPVEKAILRNDLRVSKIFSVKKVELFPCSFDTDNIQIVEIGAPSIAIHTSTGRFLP